MAKKQTKVAALPKGFTSLNSRAPIWQPEVGDVLQGTVVSKKQIDAKKAGRKKAKAGEQVTILTIADADGVVCQVWESHALGELCKIAKPGDGVYLRLDSVDKKGAKRFKNFSVGHQPKGK